MAPRELRRRACAGRYSVRRACAGSMRVALGFVASSSVEEQLRPVPQTRDSPGGNEALHRPRASSQGERRVAAVFQQPSAKPGLERRAIAAGQLCRVRTRGALCAEERGPVLSNEAKASSIPSCSSSTCWSPLACHKAASSPRRHSGIWRSSRAETPASSAMASSQNTRSISMPSPKSRYSGSHEAALARHPDHLGSAFAGSGMKFIARSETVLSKVASGSSSACAGRLETACVCRVSVPASTAHRHVMD